MCSNKSCQIVQTGCTNWQSTYCAVQPADGANWRMVWSTYPKNHDAFWTRRHQTYAHHADEMKLAVNDTVPEWKCLHWWGRWHHPMQCMEMSPCQPGVSLAAAHPARKPNKTRRRKITEETKRVTGHQCKGFIFPWSLKLRASTKSSHVWATYRKHMSTLV